MDLAVPYQKVANNNLDDAKVLNTYIHSISYREIKFTLCYYDNTYLVKFCVSEFLLKINYVFAINASNTFCVKYGFIKNEEEKNIIISKSLFPKKGASQPAIYNLSQLTDYNSIYNVVNYFFYSIAEEILLNYIYRDLNDIIKSYFSDSFIQ